MFPDLFAFSCGRGAIEVGSRCVEFDVYEPRVRNRKKKLKTHESHEEYERFSSRSVSFHIICPQRERRFLIDPKCLRKSR